MAQPLAFGRKLPFNDWEGDDYTPGAGGKYVTCQDTAAGRMVAWATNGRIDKDGRVYRATLAPRDSNGITLDQVALSVRKVTGLRLIQPQGWNWSDVNAHLMTGKGLIIDGIYDSLPRAYRYQASGDFGHAMWASHRSLASGIRTWDPLNPDTTRWGRWIPASVIRAFIESMDYYVAYIPLQPL